MDVYDETQRDRLFTAVEQSFRRLEWARNLNYGLVEEYVGDGYGRPGVRIRDQKVLNLSSQVVDAYVMSLVANRPRILVTPKSQQLKAFAAKYQVAMNNLIEEIGLEFTLKQWVLDAFFLVGIIKVQRAESGAVQLELDRWADPGSPFASNVSIDNFVFDIMAPRYSLVKFAGDMYRMPLEDLKNGPYDQDVVKKLAPTSKHTRREGGEFRLEAISQGAEVDEDELEPMVDVCDLWVPRSEKIYTFALDGPGIFRAAKQPPLAVMDADEPESGPYEILGFGDVAENILPLSPAAQLSHLEKTINNILRKQSRRARAQKQVHTYPPSEAKEAEGVRIAADDEWRQVTDPAQIKTVQSGGVDAASQQFANELLALHDRAAGNLTSILGLGAQSDTVGQEQLIHQASGKKIADMQQRVVCGTLRVIRRLGWHLWNDRAKVIPGEMALEGVDGYAVDATWTPDDREGSFEDYDLPVDVYSMPYQSPAQRANAINQLLTTLYIPLAPLLQQQGGQLNLQALTEIHAELLNEPRFREIVQFSAMPMEPGPDEEAAVKPSQTTRNYVRRSQSGGTGVQGQPDPGWLALAAAQKGAQPQ